MITTEAAQFGMSPMMPVNIVPSRGIDDRSEAIVSLPANPIIRLSARDITNMNPVIFSV